MGVAHSPSENPPQHVPGEQQSPSYKQYTSELLSGDPPAFTYTSTPSQEQ